MKDKKKRRSVLRNIGAAATVGTATSPIMVAGKEDETVVTIEKEPLDEWTLAWYDRTLRRSSEFDEIKGRMQNATNRNLEIENVDGCTITDSRESTKFDAVYYQFAPEEENIRAEIIWTKSPDRQQIFGRLAGTGTELETTSDLLRDASTAIPEQKTDQIRIERFIEPDSDIAVTSIIPDANSADQIKLEDLEFFGTADLQGGTVTVTSTSDFIDCVTSGAGGIVTGGGACAVTCRDGCFKKPNYLGCLVCAGCSVAVACYLGKCADKHLSSAFCNAALADCILPTPSAGGCGVAYGCKIGNCSII